MFLRSIFCAPDGNRTRTRLAANRILSPARLPVPPPGLLVFADPINGLHGNDLKQKIPSRCIGMEFIRAEDETRTRDPNLGKVMLYQLSYFRMCF